MKKIGGHRTSVEMAVENRKIVPFDRRGCGSLVTVFGGQPPYIHDEETKQNQGLAKTGQLTGSGFLQGQ